MLNRSQGRVPCDDEMITDMLTNILSKVKDKDEIST